MSLDALVTVNGWVGTNPRYTISENGVELTTFRLGSTKRYFNRTLGEWVDGPTTWYTVKSWRNTAKNVAESLRRSDAVVVHGRLSIETWEGPEGPRFTVVIDAACLGPDLSRGMASFRHVERRREPEEVPTPVDVSALEVLPDLEDSDPGVGKQEDSITMAEESETQEPISA